MATSDSKDKKISEVPHLEEVTGVEKIPVSAAGGEPRYVEVKQIATPISLEYIDSKLNPPHDPELWAISYNGMSSWLEQDIFDVTGVNVLLKDVPLLIKTYSTHEEAQQAIEDINSYIDSRHEGMRITFEIR